MQVVEGRDWSVAFSRNGFMPSQAGLGETVKKGLEEQELVPHVSADRPILGQLQRCFPAKTKIPEDVLWQPFLALRRAKPLDYNLATTYEFYSAMGRIPQGAGFRIHQLSKAP